MSEYNHYTSFCCSLRTVLRYKLSVQFNACVMDKPCDPSCDHQLKKVRACLKFYTSHTHNLF